MSLNRKYNAITSGIPTTLISLLGRIQRELLKNDILKVPLHMDRLRIVYDLASDTKAIQRIQADEDVQNTIECIQEPFKFITVH